MRSVQTSASVRSHCGGTSLPCLARGTPGRFNCSVWFIAPSPSCPPFTLSCFHRRLRYYEDSDSYAAPFLHQHRSHDLFHQTFQPRSLQPPFRSRWSPHKRGMGAPSAWLSPRASPVFRRLAESGPAESSSAALAGCFGLGCSPRSALHPASQRRS